MSDTAETSAEYDVLASLNKVRNGFADKMDKIMNGNSSDATANAVLNVVNNGTSQVLGPGSYISPSGGSSGISINGNPAVSPSQNIWTTISNATYAEPKILTVELHCADGSKALIRLTGNDNICNIEEKELSKWKLTAKFPFFKKEKETVTSFTYQKYYQNASAASDKNFTVKCSLSALCRLLGIEYKSFSEAIIGDAIENG